MPINTYTHTHTHIYIYTHTHICIYMCVCIYIYFIFIIQCVKAYVIPCPQQPPTRVITQFQLLKVVLPLLVLPSSFCHQTEYLKEIYIYIYARSTKSDLKTRLLSAVDVIATVSWFCIITREWWLCVHFIHVEIPSISVINSVCFFFSFFFFFYALLHKSNWDKRHIILLKDVICWSMGPLRWVFSK